MTLREAKREQRPSTLERYARRLYRESIIQLKLRTGAKPDTMLSACFPSHYAMLTAGVPLQSNSSP